MKENQANFLQVSEHCRTCHEDYFGEHNTCTTTTSMAQCGRCKTEDMVKRFSECNHHKYCPYCGEKL